MEESKQIIKVENENGEIKEAELISVFNKNDIDYAIYTIDNNDETTDLYASRLIIDEDGNDKLIDIEDSKEKAEIIEIIKEMLK